MFLWLQDYKVVARLVLQKPVQIRAESLSNHSTHPVLVWSQWSGEMPQKILKRWKKSEISLSFLQLIPPKMMTDLYTTCGAPVKRLARWKCFFLMDLIFSQLSFCWSSFLSFDQLWTECRFPAGSHNETWACSDYYQTITYFLDEVTSDVIMDDGIFSFLSRRRDERIP